MTTLFSPIEFKNIVLKNRIVMSPMCMYSSDESGLANDWHLHHLLSRAIGGVGLVMQEATAVVPSGRITENDLGIWSDSHIPKLKEITDAVHQYGAKIGIQLGHAGRKSTVSGDIFGPSSIAYNDDYKTPLEMTKEDILNTIQAFKDAAIRAKKVGYDLIEIHGAHGYLINSFLSPLTNKRDDHYGGDYWKRFELLRNIIEEIKQVWDNPLFVRISGEEYTESGYHAEHYVAYANKMKEMGVDLIDCSSGAVVPAKIKTYPGYQVSISETLKKQASVMTGAVGLITDFDQAEAILKNNQADLIFLGRVLLREPYWPLKAARYFNEDIEIPKQYNMAFSKSRVTK